MPGNLWRRKIRAKNKLGTFLDAVGDRLSRPAISGQFARANAGARSFSNDSAVRSFGSAAYFRIQNELADPRATRLTAARFSVTWSLDITT
jgi:hypothetical protein